MNAPSHLSTRTAKPPSVKAPGGFHYVCHSCGPVTGQPTGPDGRLILSYHWTLERKPGAPVVQEAPQPIVKRGAVAAFQQGDLFAG